MPLYFHTVNTFERRMGQGLYGALGATNTTFPTAPAAIQSAARVAATVATACRIGRSSRYPDRAQGFVNQGLYRAALVEAVLHCHADTEDWQSWGKLIRGETSDAGKVVTILSLVGRLSSAIVVAAGGSAETRDAFAQLASQPDALLAELASARGGGTFSGRHSLWQHNLLRWSGNAGSSASAPWSTGAKVALVAGIAIVLGGGLALATR